MSFDISYLSMVVGVILVSMVLHEIAHGWVAYLLGDQTPKAQGRLSFNPLKHLDPVLSIAMPLMMAAFGGPIFGGAKPVQINSLKLKWNEAGMALVAVAGPITNFILAFLAFCLWHYLNVPVASIWEAILVLFVQVNLGFCVFNLIPIPPLDGSRVLYALAPDFVRNLMQKVEQFGLLFIFAIIIIAGSVLSSFIGIAIHFILVEIFPKLVI
jgi:Zn-dependent protease